MKKFFFLLLAISLVSVPEALTQNRAPSPASTVTQKVGLTDVTIEYSRPGKKERTIFAADGLVPFGTLWRTGANAATKITFSDAVKVEGADLAAGSYAILTLPGETTWKVHFYPYESTRWSDYREKKPAAAVTVNSAKMEGISLETFTIDVGNLRDYSATIVFAWDNVYVPVNLTVN